MSCSRIGKLFGGCKFSPRYDISAPASWVGDYQGPAAGLVLVAEASKAQTYIHDVCERCGATIERVSRVSRDTAGVGSDPNPAVGAA